MTTQTSTDTREATRILAEYAANLSYDQLPDDVVPILKQLVLDTIGVSLAATTVAAGCREAVALARASGGPPESTIIGFGDKVSVLMAAFANGGLAHGMQFDNGGPGGHTASCTLPSALAVAEKIGGVSGKDLLTAMAAGIEVQGRIGMALSEAGVNTASTFLGTQVFGAFGSAASAGRILRLTPERMASALGVAMMQGSGTMQLLLSGDPPVKGIYAAFPNLQGVLAALLAQQGLDATFDALEGELGLFKLYFGKYEREPLVKSPSEVFYVRQSTFKLSPVSGPNPFMQAAWKLKSEQNLDPHSIAKVHLKVKAQRRPWLEPAADRQEPHNQSAAADSIFFGLAKALVNPSFSIDDLTESGLRQRDAIQMAKLMSWSALEAETDQTETIEVTTTEGRMYSCPVGPGKMLRPAMQTPPELIEKFYDCARYSIKPLSEKALGEVVTMVEHLDHLDDVGSLVRLVSNNS